MNNARVIGSSWTQSLCPTADDILDCDEIEKFDEVERSTEGEKQAKARSSTKSSISTARRQERDIAGHFRVPHRTMGLPHHLD